MNIDSQIANSVLDHFTKKGIAVLCILDQATHQITKDRIGHDIKNKRISHRGKVTGNIKGYEEPVEVEYHTPIRIKPTRQYLNRKAKFNKWLELQETT